MIREQECLQAESAQCTTYSFVYIYLFIWLQVYSTISGIAALSMALHKLRNIPYVIHKIIRQVPIIHGTHQLVN